MLPEVMFSIPLPRAAQPVPAELAFGDTHKELVTVAFLSHQDFCFFPSMLLVFFFLLMKEHVSF